MSSTLDSSFEMNEPMVISETIDRETVIINLATGSYYSLRYSGPTIWTGIQQAASLADIAAAVRSDFVINGQDVEQEVSALVQKLIEEDLVRPATGKASPLAPGQLSAAVPIPFQAPVLEKFTDMEAMLLLDPVHDVDDEGWPNRPLRDDLMDA
jgi:hypothetical protein